MTTYYLSRTNSDITMSGADFSYVLVTSPEYFNSVACSIAKSATEYSYGYSAAGDPNTTEFTTGSSKIYVFVTSASSDIYLKLRLSRVDSAGTVQESATETAEQNLASVGSYTFNINSMDWSTGASSDRIQIRYAFRNAKTTARSVTIRTGLYEHNLSIEKTNPYPVLTRSPSGGAAYGLHVRSY